MVVYNWTRDGMVVSNRDTPAPEYISLSDHLTRLAEVERLIPREVKLKLAADGDSVAETVYKLVSDWELTHALYKQTYDERDALQRELAEVKAKYEQVKNDPDYQQCCELRDKEERETQRLREALERIASYVGRDQLDLTRVRQMATGALHLAARRGGGGRRRTMSDTARAAAIELFSYFCHAEFDPANPLHVGDLCVLEHALQQARAEGLRVAMDKARDMRDAELMKTPDERIGDGSVQTIEKLIVELKGLPS